MTDKTAEGRLAGRLALITGASRGIGAAVAERFAAEGAKVILTARTPGGLREIDDRIRAAGGEEATLIPLDLRDFEKVDALGPALYERFGKLDILVGNAAILGTLGPCGHIDPATWQAVMDINVTANFRLIRALDPLLQRAEAGRAIFVTSGAARQPFAYWGAYATSKAALEMLIGTYAAETAKTPVRVNLVNPGIVRTNLRAQAFPGEDPEKLQPAEAVTERFVELATPDCRRHGATISVL